MNYLSITFGLIFAVSINGLKDTKKDCKIVELNEDDYDDIHHMMKTFNTFLANNVETNNKLIDVVNKGNQIAESNGRVIKNLNEISKTKNDAIRNLREEMIKTVKSIQEFSESVKVALDEMREESRQNFMTLFDAFADFQGESRKPKKISRKKNTPDSKDNPSDMLREIMKNINEMKAEMNLQKQTLSQVQIALNKRPFDCSDISAADESRESGVYKIYPFGDPEKSVKVFCDLETNEGGWTVFLTRQQQNLQENFSRSWQDYKNGFGNPYAEYWLGNEALHQMTNRRNYSLRIEGRAEGLQDTWGEFQKFLIFSEESNYKIHFADGSDGLMDFESWFYHNDLEFSTYDRDNDHGKWNCAKDWKGGWWFKEKCYEYFLTGVYGAKDGTGLIFGSWTKDNPHFSFPNFVQMKIRPAK